MTVKCGVDIIEVERVRKAIEETGEAFLSRVFTPGEIEYCEGKGRAKYRSYAARLAAKEAASKALGTGIAEGVSWCEIEVHKNGRGEPSLVFHGRTGDLIREHGVVSHAVSLSHCQETAMAMVVLECGSGG
jgi:holo-[acyl-carrier protein] synthase